jgi:hypothetical protein
MAVSEVDEVPTASWSRNFTFSQGSLGRYLDTLDEKLHEYIKHDLQVTAERAQAVLKIEAPWTQTGMVNRWGRMSTGRARNGLWCDPWWDSAGNYSILMGHEAPYGIYLEEGMGQRFQVVMPVLVAVARGFMESLTAMLNQLDNPAPGATVEPGVGAGRGTSQGASGHAEHVKGVTEHATHTPRVSFRNAKGQYTAYKGVKIGEGATKPTKTTKKKTAKKTGTKTTAKTKKTATVQKSGKWAGYNKSQGLGRG